MTSWHPQGEDDRPSLDEQLRAALGSTPDFDHAALLAGTSARAGRLRRRQALTQAAVAAVLVPTLAGTGWVVGQRLSVDSSPDGSVATQTQEPVEDLVVVTQDVVDGTAAPAPSTDPTDATVATTGAPRAATTPPHQDPALLPKVYVETNPNLLNRTDIPDPRPTDIPELTALGAPTIWAYPRTVPLLGFVAARDAIGMDPDTGVEPHSGYSADWMYPDQDPAASSAASVTLNVTRWEDAGFALEQLRTGGTELSTIWLGTQRDGSLTVVRPDPLTWPGHEGTEDLLVVQGQGTDSPAAGALVRQGNYLVGATVYGTQGDSTADLADFAATIAEASAANLAALDPEGAGG